MSAPAGVAEARIAPLGGAWCVQVRAHRECEWVTLTRGVRTRTRTIPALRFFQRHASAVDVVRHLRRLGFVEVVVSP